MGRGGHWAGIVCRLKEFWYAVRCQDVFELLLALSWRMKFWKTNVEERSNSGHLSRDDVDDDITVYMYLARKS